MAESRGEKIHPATPHRREQARRQGHYPRSNDLASAGTLLASLLALYMLGHHGVEQILHLLSWQLGSGGLDRLSPDQLISHVVGLVATCLHLLLPLVGVLFLAAYFSHWSQSRYSVVPQRLAVSFDHLAPGEGTRRLFSLSSGIRCLMGLLKIATVTAIACYQAHRHGAEILHSFQYSLPRLAGFLVELLFWAGLQVALGLAALALLEYGFQYWKYEQDLRMTDQELREELRTIQGDPQLPMRRRALQRAARVTYPVRQPPDGLSTSSYPNRSR